MDSNKCPACGETDTIINEIDYSICCNNCGTVIESSTLQEGFEVGQVTVKSRSTKPKGLASGLKIWWNKISAYFTLPEEFVAEGCRMIDKYKGKLPYHSEIYNEICLALICSVGKHLRPDWTYDEYIDVYPESLHRLVVIKYFHLFEGDEVGTYVWKGPLEAQTENTIRRVYPCILKQLFGEKKEPREFTPTVLIEFAKKLLELGSSQGVNSGKMARQVISVVACICAQYLRSVTFSSLHNQPVDIKKVKIQPKRKRKVPRSSVLEKNDMLHTWDFTPFSKVITGASTVFRDYYKEYRLMLIACTKKMPWIEQPVNKDVFLHLGDILEAFGKVGDNPPMMTLTLEEFAPLSFIKNREQDMNIKAITKEAIKYNDNTEGAEVENSLVYDAYLALEAGHDAIEIESWTINLLRKTGEMLRFRKKFALSLDNNQQINPNRVEPDKYDMDDKELAFYIK